MSGYDTNPFAAPDTDPFSDHGVTEARGVGANPDNLNDFNPFANDQTSTQTKEPAVLPPSSTQPAPYITPSQVSAYDSGTEDVRRRQEELERKAAELERRERAMQQSARGQAFVNNFPPLPSFCPIKPCFYQDFELEIPVEFQRVVKAVYYTWITYSIMMFLNFLGSMAYFFGCIKSCSNTEEAGVTLGLSVVYLVLFIPCSFICWYRPLYKAFRSDSSFNFFVFFFIFFCQSCVCIIQCLGPPSSGTVGLITGAMMVGDNVAVAGIMLVVGCLYGLLAAVCFILLTRVHRFYRSTGASFTKAQAEFAQGVVTNRTVQQTATGVAASAAQGAMNQYGSSDSRY